MYFGPNKDYEFCPISFKVYMQVVNDDKRNLIDFRCQRKGKILHYKTEVLVQSLSNFTRKFRIMRGGTLLMIGCGVKGQDRLWDYVNINGVDSIKTTVLPDHFKLHMQVKDDERRNLMEFGSLGQRSRSTLALFLWNLLDIIRTSVFDRSLSTLQM